MAVAAIRLLAIGGSAVSARTMILAETATRTRRVQNCFIAQKNSLFFQKHDSEWPNHTFQQISAPGVESQRSTAQLTRSVNANNTRSKQTRSASTPRRPGQLNTAGSGVNISNDGISLLTLALLATAMRSENGSAEQICCHSRQH